MESNKLPAAPDPADLQWDELLGAGALQRVNLTMVGPHSASLRLSRLIFTVLVRLVNEHGTSAFAQVWVLLPPDHSDTVVEDLVAATPTFRGSPLDADEREAVSRRLQVQRMTTFELGGVAHAINTAPPGSFIVALEAARYRPASAEATPPGVLQAPEDRWLPHVIDLAARCVVGIATTNCVVLDVGQFLPSLSRNIHALETLGCTVWSLDAPRAMDDAHMEKLGAWTRRVERGDIVSVLADIDATSGLTVDSKELAKIQILHRGGRSTQAVELLRAYQPRLAGAPADLLLKLANVASAGEDLALAAQLMESSAAGLTDTDLNELALEMTQSLPSVLVERQSTAWLARHFPSSPILQQYQLRKIFHAARDRITLTADPAAPLPLDEYAQFVTSRLGGTEVPDYFEFVETAEARWPQRRTDTLLAATLNARARGLPMYVALIAVAIDTHVPLANSAANALLWSIERLLLTGDDTSHDALADAVLFLLGYLAGKPSDTAVRERLDELLSVDVAGSVGIALLTHALLRLAKAPSNPPVAPPEKGPEFDEAAFWAFYHPAAKWVIEQRSVDLSKLVLPEPLLNLPAARALSDLKQLAQHMISQEEADDVQSLRLMVTVAFAVAPHAPDSVDDLEVLRLVSSNLVVRGQAQAARDLVEAGLAATHRQPARVRLAWYAYGDVFDRMKNRSRALLAFGCALATQAPVGLEHAYYETMGLVRALRETGMWEQARELLGKCEQLLVQLGLQASMGHRVETVRLSLTLSQLGAARSRDGAAWSALLRAVDANLQAVVREDDEMAPALVLAMQILRRADALKLVVDPEIRARLHDATQGVGEFTGDVVDLAANTAGGPERLLERVQAAQHARYADDVGFDVHWIVRAARAELSDAATLADPVTASFVAELTTDHAISLPGAAEGTWLPATLAESAGVLQDLSRGGLRIELLAVDSDNRLVRVTAQDGELTVHREDAAFSLQRLHTWSLRFPYDYGLDSRDPNLFYTSTQGLGLSHGVGDRALFVLDTRLQRLPPQLLSIEGELLGRGAAVAVAPSLTWLKAMTAAPRRHFAPPAAWISTAVGISQAATLATVADRVSDVLAQHGVALHTGAHVPEHLQGAQLAMVAAHGGLADDNRFFKVISDEAQLQLSGPTLARALEGAGVVVLFVCSAGRQDEHPVASTTVGLPKQLLDRGSAAVIASPWPLDSRVPSHWLPAFLAAWDAGERLIDGNAAANRAVQQQMGDNPAYVMAMTLYGNPFVRRQDLTD